MNLRDDEPDLRRRFETWREQETKSAPEFQFLWARAGREAANPARSGGAKLRFRLALGGAALALLAAGVWLATQRDPQPGANPAANLADWNAHLASLESDLAEPEPSGWAAPTDYLLATTSDNDTSTIAAP